MGKRYGRNQKRKHRERIADLEKAVGFVASCEARAYDAERRLERLTRAIHEVTPLSALLPPRAERYSSDLVRECGLTAWDPFANETRNIPVYVLEHHVRENRERFETVIHFKARSSKDSLGFQYCLSPEALRRSRSLEFVRRELDLAVDSLCKKVAEHAD